jgi:hypothetical protein
LSPSPSIILAFTDARVLPSSSPTTVITSLNHYKSELAQPGLSPSPSIILALTDARVLPSSSPTTIITSLNREHLPFNSHILSVLPQTPAMSSLFFEDCTFNAAGGDIHNVFNRTEGLNVFNNCTFNVTHVHLPPPPRPPHKFADTGKRATEQIRKAFLKVFSYVYSTRDLLLIAQVTLHVAELDLRYPALWRLRNLAIAQTDVG